MAGFVLFGWMIFSVIRKFEFGIRNYGKEKEKFIIHNSLFTILLLGFVDHYPLTLQQGQLLLTIFLSVTMSAW